MSEPTDTSGTSELQAAEPSEVARGFAPQLYLLPLLVTLGIVVVWLVFSWSLPAETDPQALVRDMRGPNHGSWQKAYALAELLRHPRNESLRENAPLCRELATILDEQLQAVSNHPSQTQFRVFLCRALGEFHVVDGLPSLLQAAEISQRRGHVDVTCASLEALAVLADNIGPDLLRRDSRAMSVLLDASGVAREPGARVSNDRVAATAAFTLGVVGGPDATPRLRQLLDDRRPDVRYNAATGLARDGDTASIPVLLEMLDTDNQLSLEHVPDAALSARHRELIWSNALRAVMRLIATNPRADRSALLHAVERLRGVPVLPARLRSAVQAAHCELRGQHGCSSDGGGL